MAKRTYTRFGKNSSYVSNFGICASADIGEDTGRYPGQQATTMTDDSSASVRHRIGKTNVWLVSLPMLQALPIQPYLNIAGRPEKLVDFQEHRLIGYVEDLIYTCELNYLPDMMPG